LPLEVRQIGIRLNVGDEQDPDGDGGPGSSGDGQGIDPAERAGIIEDCVEAVLTALRMQSER
jgi:hypothetical protein